MRALLDTNIILDLLLDRTPFADEAETIWKAHEQGRFHGFISAITPVNIYYIARKLKGSEIARQTVGEVLSTFQVSPLDGSTLHGALALTFSDYEDAVQYASAVASGVDTIVTRNVADFKSGTLSVLSPKDFIKQLP